MTVSSFLTQTFSLEGKLAVVTGASRGIGLAIATSLAQAGADIIGASHSMPAGDSAARKAIESTGQKFYPLQVDLSDRSSVSSFITSIDELCNQLGQNVEILVNNGGTIRRNPAADHSDADFDYVMETNLRSAWVLSREIGRKMLQQGHGRIINTASMLSFQGGINVPGYTASKSALAGLTKALANEWASAGVTVNAIAPGYVASDNTANLRADEKRSAEILSRIPAGRWADPADIGGAAIFLASSAADYVNGIILPVDGGWLAR